MDSEQGWLMMMVLVLMMLLSTMMVMADIAVPFRNLSDFKFNASKVLTNRFKKWSAIH
jgi:hypothetical protein